MKCVFTDSSISPRPDGISTRFLLTKVAHTNIYRRNSDLLARSTPKGENLDSRKIVEPFEAPALHGLEHSFSTVRCTFRRFRKGFQGFRKITPKMVQRALD